jgi:hypothetical protein
MTDKLEVQTVQYQGRDEDGGNRLRRNVCNHYKRLYFHSTVRMEPELNSETLVTIYRTTLVPLYSEDGISKFLRNVVKDLPDYRASSQKTADQIFVSVTAVRTSNPASKMP